VTEERVGLPGPVGRGRRGGVREVLFQCGPHPLDGTVFRTGVGGGCRLIRGAGDGFYDDGIGGSSPRPVVPTKMLRTQGPALGGDDSGWDSLTILSGCAARIQYILRKRRDRSPPGVLVVGLLIVGRWYWCVSGHRRSGLAFACPAGAGRPRGRARCRDVGPLVGWRVVAAGCLLVGQGWRWVSTVIR
jgi:hypothetical protein